MSPTQTQPPQVTTAAIANVMVAQQHLSDLEAATIPAATAADVTSAAVVKSENMTAASKIVVLNTPKNSLVPVPQLQQGQQVAPTTIAYSAGTAQVGATCGPFMLPSACGTGACLPTGMVLVPASFLMAACHPQTKLVYQQPLMQCLPQQQFLMMMPNGLNAAAPALASSFSSSSLSPLISRQATATTTATMQEAPTSAAAMPFADAATAKKISVAKADSDSCSTSSSTANSSCSSNSLLVAHPTVSVEKAEAQLAAKKRAAAAARRRELRRLRPKKMRPCTECGREFSCASNLKRHMSLHTGVMPYSCAHCGMRFRNSTNRRKHERQHCKNK